MDLLRKKLDLGPRLTMVVLGSKGRFRAADVIDDREGQVSEPY